MNRITDAIVTNKIYAHPVRPVYQVIPALMAKWDPTAIEDLPVYKASVFRSIDLSKMDVVVVHPDPKAIPADPAALAVPVHVADLVKMAEMAIQVTADKPVQPDHQDQHRIITVVPAIEDLLDAMTETKFEEVPDQLAHKDQLVPQVHQVPQVPTVVTIITQAVQVKAAQLALQETMEHPAPPATEDNPARPAVIVNIARVPVIIIRNRRRPKKRKQKRKLKLEHNLKIFFMIPYFKICLGNFLL